jgi:PAS domain S-box-containing protein
MHIPVLEFDPLLLVTYANAAALEMLKLEKGTFEKGVHVDSLIVPEQQELVHDGIQKLKSGADPTSISLRVLGGGGLKIPTQTYTDRIIVDGKLAGYVAYVVDLSRRAAVEEKILSRMEILELIVDYYSFSGIIIVDEKYKFEYVNDKLCDILGRLRSELLGHDFREFLHPDSVDLVAERYQKRQKGEDVPSLYEFKVLRKDGTPRDIRMNVGAIKGRDGRMRTVAQLLDITDQKERARLLTESEHRYRSLVETMDSGLSVDNTEGVTVLANDALRKMLGYDSVDDVIGIPITEIVHGWTENDVKSKLDDRKLGKIEHYEAQLKTKSGATLPVMVTASPLFGPNDEYLGSMAVFTDISELKQAEGEVHFLLDLLLHDIGNQLQLVLAGGDFLGPDVDQAQIERSRRYILDGANRCLELIQKVRRAEESKEQPLRPVNIAKVIRTEAELIYRQRGVQVDMGDLPKRVVVHADQAASQLVWNLLENAVVHNDMDPANKLVKVRGRLYGDTFSLSVSDNGPGLSDSKKEELFDPSRRYGGVGLHLVRRLVEKYGGTVEVTDRVRGKPEHGLKFVVRLQIVE